MLFQKTLQSLFDKKRAIKKGLLQEEWNIGIIYEPIHIFLNVLPRPKINWLPIPRKGTFLADPFGIVRDGKLIVFYEYFNYHSQKGSIYKLDFDTINGKMLNFRTQSVIESQGHISYPYIIEYQGEVYCIPETYMKREVGLYKATSFPDRWEKICTLINDIPAVDPTVFQYNGYWWLMCTNQDEGENNKLFAWYAPNLFGPWKPHAGNPIKTDLASARPAGTPFIYNNSLYRPSQDCSKTYGGRVIINRIIRLTTTEFQEEVAAVVNPFSDCLFSDGLHTLASVGNITLIDSRRYVAENG
jgi:hypothetical protein